MAKKDEQKAEGDAAVVETTDSPLLDLTDAAVKRMIKIAKKRGWVTHEELNAVLPSEEISSDQIEDMNAMLNEMGINVVDNEDAEEAEKDNSESGEEEEAEGGEVAETTRASAVATRSSEPAERTDDPVRMYLREMGSVELLSREGEIAIAKRIEAGREAMIAGLCESPLTFQAIIIWRDELNDAKILLRDIIDLEATYAGPDGKKAPKIDMTAPGAAEALAAQQRERAPATAPQTPPAGFDGDPPPSAESFEDDDDMENSVSLSAMEAELKPKVLETFDRVADAYKKLRRLQEQNVENKLKNEALTIAQERKYKSLKKEIVADVKSLSLNQNRIDALVEQLVGDVLVLQAAQLLVSVGDAVERLEHLRLELGLHRRQRHRILQIVVVVEAFGRRRGLAVETGGRGLRRGGGRDAFARRRRRSRQRGGRHGFGGAGRGHVDLRLFLAVGAGVGRFEVDDVAQQNLAVVELVAPDDDRLERQRAFAQAGDHRLAAGFDALGDGDLALARQQLDRAHLAQIHPHRIVGALDRLGAAGGDRGRARGLDQLAGLGLLLVGGGLGSGFLLGFFGVLAVDDVDAHLAEHRVHVFDLIGGDLLRRQHRVQLFLSDPAALLGDLDHPFDGGVGEVEQRTVGGFYDDRFAFGLLLFVSRHFGLS